MDSGCSGCSAVPAAAIQWAISSGMAGLSQWTQVLLLALDMCARVARALILQSPTNSKPRP